jgi:transcriptional regulator with XRE-family HTH domain
MDMVDTTLSQRLREAREAQGYSREALASRLGVSRDLIGSLERGTVRNPRFSNLVAMAAALDVTPSWLLTGRRDPGTDRLITHEAAQRPRSSRLP